MLKVTSRSVCMISCLLLLAISNLKSLPSFPYPRGARLASSSFRSVSFRLDPKEVIEVIEGRQYCKSLVPWYLISDGCIIHNRSLEAKRLAAVYGARDP